ncbi:MAG: Nif3-like dinuclear metal center hexameric protein [Planctomycetota bacterium]|nr:Nif3-like dinuclear metal center hexameric protein [Planctomycetota bacterium]MDA1106294.1 Nif3-like dinuclear metal center hexameric protein [Planctomycetota bacterium]
MAKKTHKKTTRRAPQATRGATKPATTGSPRRPRRAPEPTPPGTVGDLLGALNHLAPFHLAEDWDNVGLIAGDAGAACSRVLLAIDATPEVLDEAIDLGVQAIVAYHPPLFEKTRRVAAGSAAFEAARAGIALLSPHTALDNAANGVNDMLAWAVGDGGRAPLVPSTALPEAESLRIVTHVPADAADAVRDAMARAGAGRIGNYTHCSFAAPGTGSFMGGKGTNPVIGAAGRLESVAEVRLEMPCSAAALPGALAALRRAHPYEEPAMHIESGAPRTSATEGAGRVVVLAKAATTDATARRLTSMLGVDQVQVSATDAKRKHAIVGICAGSGESMLDAAIDKGATLFVTGEMKHHDLLRARAAGVDVILCGHTESERPYLPILGERLAAALPGMAFTLSHLDQPPLRVVCRAGR